MSDTDWPAGVPFGQLTPAQKAAACKRAGDQLSAELQQAAPLITAALDEADAEASEDTTLGSYKNPRLLDRDDLDLSGLRRHVRQHHPATKIPRKNTDLAVWHLEQHWRYSPDHIHRGDWTLALRPDGSKPMMARPRPSGEFTGREVVTREQLRDEWAARRQSDPELRDAITCNLLLHDDQPRLVRRLTADVGRDEHAVRSELGRMVREGLAERVDLGGGFTGYQLTPAGKTG